MGKYSAVGTGAEVKACLERFKVLASADELMTVHPAPTIDLRLRSVELVMRS
jgi:hypothetical protein